MNPIFREAPITPALADLIAAIPELRPTTFAEITARVGPQPLLLLAEQNGRAVGFKLGYPLASDTFYSWIGGVVPDARRGGVARALLRHQETLAAARGARLLRVKSMERFPAMLSLLRREGYAVVTTEPDGKIVFEKRLHEPKLHEGEAPAEP